MATGSSKNSEDNVSDKNMSDVNKESYGGLDGPNSEFVKLISCDNHEFVLRTEYAVLAGTIQRMLANPGQCLESTTNEIHFRDIHSYILCEICKYLMHHHLYAVCKAPDYQEYPIDTDIALELLMAANFLDC